MATYWATCTVGTISIASHGQTVKRYGSDFLVGIATQTSQPTQRSTSISQNDCSTEMSTPGTLMIQSTGQTSRHDSQPVQLSALMTATSFGSFFLDPAFAIFHHIRASVPRLEELVLVEVLARYAISLCQYYRNRQPVLPTGTRSFGFCFSVLAVHFPKSKKARKPIGELQLQSLQLNFKGSWARCSTPNLWRNSCRIGLLQPSLTQGPALSEIQGRFLNGHVVRCCRRIEGLVRIGIDRSCPHAMQHSASD